MSDRFQAQPLLLLSLLALGPVTLASDANTYDAATANTTVNNLPSIAPFTTDGCSSFPDGTWAEQQLWLDCCIQHDFAYWQGGSYSERTAADRALEACVAELGETEISLLMFLGVRVGGTPFIPTNFRWGYGWPEWRGYQALTEEEKAVIDQAVAKLPTELKAQLVTVPERPKD